MASHTLIGSGGPPLSVLKAFGVSPPAVRLDGGRGTSWRVEHLVLKPLDMSEQELRWQAAVIPALPRRGFRMPSPRPALDGSLIVHGWCAWDAVSGRHEEGRWPDIIVAGERLHESLRSVGRPDFLGLRSDPWAVADRVAWGEADPSPFSSVKHVDRLVCALRPVSEASQIIHGDLTGNVLFDDGHDPAIIDFSPYWRPPQFASAIVVTDALMWEGANDSLLEAVAHVPSFGQYFVRALIFRIIAHALFRPLDDEPDVALPVVELALSTTCR